MSNSLSKMYLLSPESYNRILQEKKMQSKFDNEMYNIIKMHKITDTKKWYLYRQQLMNFANKMRGNKTQPDITFSEPTRNKKNNAVVKHDATTQTKFYKSKDAKIQTSPMGMAYNENIFEHAPQLEKTLPNPDISSITNYDEYAGMDFNAEDLTSPTDRRRISQQFRQPIFHEEDEPLEQSFRQRAATSVATIGHTLKQRSGPRTRAQLKKSNESTSQMVINFPIRKAVKTPVQRGKNAFIWQTL